MVVVEWVVEAALSRRGQSSMETGLVARSFWCFYQKKIFRIRSFPLDTMRQTFFVSYCKSLILNELRCADPEGVASV
jgi:hypothetical protein